MPSRQITEIIFGFGHENVQATHRTTVEFTKDPHLSKKGDCILVVSADKGLADLSQEFKVALKKPHAQLTVRIDVNGISETIQAQGSPQLALTHLQEIVIRKSNYASDRTLGIRADKAAKDISRDLVEKLRNPTMHAKITLTVQV